jgi:cell division protein FtsB
MHSMMIEYLIPSLKIVMSVQKDVQVVKSEQQKQMQTLTKKVVKMEHELKSVKTENQRLSIANDLLCDKINRLESYSRRNNILIQNVPEDDKPLLETINNFLTHSLKLTDVNTIMFEDYHRLGKHKPRPIIIRLLIRADWRKIWYAKKNLKGTKFILTEDLPEDYRRNRGILMPVMVAAKQKTNKHCSKVTN